MKFKYSAFTENTPEMREWCMENGIMPFLHNKGLNDLGKYIKVFGTGLRAYSCSDIAKDIDGVDCTGNPALFKAVTAIREDSDYILEDGIVWATIEEFPNYQVSHLGDIRSLNYNRSGNIKNMSPVSDKHGYKICVIRNNKHKKTIHIHREVARLFIPNLSNLPQVNHKDGNKSNNSIENLEWCNQSHNMAHAYKNNLNPKQKGVIQKSLDNLFIKEYISAHQASRETGVNRGNISNCCLGNIKQAGGFIWEHKATLSELIAHFKVEH